MAHKCGQSVFESEADDASVVEEIASLLEEQASIEELFEIVVLGDRRKWPALRSIHKKIFGNSPYAVDWTRIFTPIERAAWSELRYYSIPMRPQFPIGRVFVDFADPHKKICIECDGAEFHDQARDRLRDEILNAHGWCVFRISGADCWREPEIIEDPDDEQSDEWLRTTMAGFATCLREAFYSRGDGCSPAAAEALSLRCGGYRWESHA